VFTLANADAGGREITHLITKYCASRPGRAAAFASLGQTRYFSALRYAEFVIGNSSSGIIEAPSLGVPTINIGCRQRGRVKAASVVDCGYGSEEIAEAIRLVRSEQFRKIVRYSI
jgi:UDP-N-acetylglucosamine 2-epimerase